MPDTTHPHVFLSSAFRGLEEYRKVAIDAIWRANMYPIGLECLPMYGYLQLFTISIVF
jgi:hypothetical protein